MSKIRSVAMLGAASAAVVAAVALGGCDYDPHPGWDEPLAPEGPYEMEEGVAYLDRDFETLVMVRSLADIDDEEQEDEQEAGDGPTLEVERFETGIEPGEAAVSADGEQLYVVNRGRLHGDESLSIFEIEDGDVERTDIDLSSYYDEITVDPEGEFVLLSNTGDEQTVAQPLHELGIVDLREDEPEFRRATLRTRAGTPELLEPFEMDGIPERFAAVTATNRVTLVDLNAAEDELQDRVVPLTTSETDEITPTDLVFDPPVIDEDDQLPERASLFVLDDTSDSVTQVLIQPSIDQEADHRLDISVNQPAAGDRPRAIEVVHLEDVGQRLVVLDGQRAQFSLLDVDSEQSATFELPMGGPASAMKSYTREVEVDGETRRQTRILVYSNTSELMAVIRPEAIAVGGETPIVGDAVDEIRLDSPPSSVALDEQLARAVVLHDGGDDGFTVLDLETNQELVWDGANLSQVVFHGEDAAYGLFADSPHLARFDLTTNTSRHYEIPDVGEALFVDPGGETLLIQHEGDAGRFTTVPREVVDAREGGLFEDARLYEHAFLHELLERPVFEEDDEDEDDEQ